LRVAAFAAQCDTAIAMAMKALAARKTGRPPKAKR
jgi:hypothetical protein